MSFGIQHLIENKLFFGIKNERIKKIIQVLNYGKSEKNKFLIFFCVSLKCVWCKIYCTKFLVFFTEYDSSIEKWFMFKSTLNVTRIVLNEL